MKENKWVLGKWGKMDNFNILRFKIFVYFLEVF